MKPTAVPSRFKWKTENKCAAGRKARSLRRQEKEKVTTDIDSLQPQEYLEVGAEISVIATSACNGEENCPSQSQSSALTYCNTGVQTEQRPPFCVENFMSDDEGVHYYTGLENYSKFMYVLASLGPAAYHLNYYTHRCDKLSVADQLFMTLIKLRLHTPNFELSRMFDMSEYSVSNVFITWINFMYRQWNDIDIMPSRDMTTFFMPDDFRAKFPATRVIIDGMECPIKKPKNPLAQQATFSSYKNRNTLKAVIGSTPGGLISLVSQAYGGSTSDRHVVERLSLGNVCDPGDSVMADKGFNIQDLLATHDVHVNIPTFLKKKNRFGPKTLARDRKVASKRVHIERHIGLVKSYKILSQPMNPSEAVLGSEIIFVCCMLCNFRSCIVPFTA